MPYYEYRCLNCRKRFEIFLTFEQYDAHQAACPHCASQQVERYIRKVRVSHGDRGRLESLAGDENLDSLDYDPKSLGRMMREMKGEVGADDLPEEFDEVVDRLEKGQSPEDIEKDLPGLGESS
ncbi:MAG TPA: zinc ribbon domain-containing protein [Anaerolineaceae bacterium]|nr:zinc ribbon domain-containing protein [Anaerolineaceae bacterium]